MDRYKRYMDSVEPSAGFLEELKKLEAPAKPAVWRKYGAMAAALVLVAGLGALGVGRFLPRQEAGQPELGEPVTEPAVLPTGEPVGPGQDMISMGGYEVRNGEMAAYFMLPYIHYQEENSQLALDYSLAPPGAWSRDATRNDLIFMTGDADSMKVHLGWDDSLDWGGVIWFGEGGSPCAACVYAEGQDVLFTIEMMEGSEVPECCIVPDENYTTTEFCGVEILGLKNMSRYVNDDGVEMRESRKVSFFTGEMGYKLTIYGTDAGKVDDLAARFARWAIIEGFDLEAVVMDGAEPMDPGVGEPDHEDEANTPAYDPNAE